MSALLVIIVAVVVPLLLYWRYPERTEAIVSPLLTATNLAFALAALFGALILIGTGLTGLMLLGAVLLAYGIFRILYNDQLASVRRRIPGLQP